MAITYARINPSMLTWARQRAEVSVEVLAEKIKVPTDKLHNWETGEKPPTFRQAQNFAKITHIPFGYLFLEVPPQEEFPIPDLRTIDGSTPKKPSTELRDIVAIMSQRRDWYREYLLGQEHQPLSIVGRFNLDASAERIVRDMRQELDLSQNSAGGKPDEYFLDLVRRIEGAGVLVMRQGNIGHWSRPLNEAEFRGFALADRYAPLIFVNQADAPAARLFTLIHELAHIWVGTSGVSDTQPSNKRPSEVLCNAVAAEFLVPQAEFLRQWTDEISDTWQGDLPRLATTFHVSTWVIARRALTLQKITLEQYRDYVQDIQEQYKNRPRGNGGPTYYRTLKAQISQRFATALVSEALSGRTLLRDAGKILGVKPQNIATFAKELGF